MNLFCHWNRNLLTNISAIKKGQTNAKQHKKILVNPKSENCIKSLKKETNMFWLHFAVITHLSLQIVLDHQ